MSVTDTEEKIDRVITAPRCISQSQNASNTESIFHGKMIHIHPDDKFIDPHNVRFRVLSFIFICWRRPIKLVLVDPQCVELHLISLGIMPIILQKMKPIKFIQHKSDTILIWFPSNKMSYGKWTWISSMPTFDPAPTIIRPSAASVMTTKLKVVYSNLFGY